MKSYLRVLTVGLFALLFTVAVASPAFAQECDQETKTALYQTYLDNYNSNNVADLQKAVDAAKEYIKLCGEKPEEEQLVTYFKDGYPKIEQRIKDIVKADEEKKRAQAELARLKSFEEAYKAKNWAQVFTLGEEALKHPEVKIKFDLDMRIGLAARGLYLLEDGDTKYTDETLKYAKEAISRISAGQESGSGKWGVFIEWNTKENALGQLNYAIGYANYYAETAPMVEEIEKLKEQGIAETDPKIQKLRNEIAKEHDEAIPYYYKATQFNSETKKFAPIYVTLGSWYQSKAGEIGKKREVLDLTEAAGEQQQANIDKAYEYLAMEKAYVERAMDAYARALSIAKTDKGATAEFKAGLFEQLKNLFAFRYSEPTEEGKKTDASINSYVASVSSNSLPNPANEPAPVQVKPEGADKATDGSTEGATSDTTGSRSRTVGTTASKKAGN